MTNLKQEQREHLQLWVAALRSGKYKQGWTRLHREEEFCCLGVACEISGLGRWMADDDGSDIIWYLGYTSVLPPVVQHWLGVPNELGLQLQTRQAHFVGLECLNDEGMTFSQIADLIEYEYAL